MSTRNIRYSSDPEARKVVARNMELPHCEGLRVFAGLTSILQFVLTSKGTPNQELTLLVQVGFIVIGFLSAAYLLRDRDLTTMSESYGSDSLFDSFKGLIRTLPLPQMATVVILVLLLPRMVALEGFRMPDMAEVPVIVVKLFSTYFSDFQRTGFDGRTLLMFPLVILFVPRRCLSLVLLSVLGSAMILQFAGLFSGSVRQASVFVSPSAFDLLALGCFVAVIARHSRIGQSEAQIGTSALMSGFLVAIGMVALRSMNFDSGTVSFRLFAAPANFGVVNFIVEVVGTTLISSLWWRDLGGMMEDLNRAPAH